MNESPLEDLIRQDLAAFADPGSSISLNQTRDWLQASWEQHGRLTTASFRSVGAGNGTSVQVRTAAGAEMGYAAFLASDRMGDLRSLAHHTVGAIRAVPAYVPPRALPGDTGRAADANDLVQELAAPDGGLTKLIFITADAGVGKTSLLTELVRRKAIEYANGRGTALWLYVNAQGSRLARLDQALAAALDDVRAPFPYHATAALVRCNALILVIDGFDELIGAPGTYEDAYSSLATFLLSLDGHGSVVATARSAYYEQEFLARAGNVAGFSGDAWSLERVALSGWNDNERSRFLGQYARAHHLSDEAAGEFAADVLAVFEESNLKDLEAKPFFLARVAEFTIEGRGLEPGRSFLDRLVNTYLAREARGKLLTSIGGPVLTEEQLASFYEEIANEMWREETRELSRSSFHELIDLIAQLHDLSDDSRELVVDRLPNSALVHSGGTAGSVAFEHEIFFSYFLARPIVRAFNTGDAFNVGVALRRGRLPNQAGEIAGRALCSRAEELLPVLRESSATVSMGGEQVRQNAGSIMAGMLREGVAAGLVIGDMDFVDVDLSRITCERVRFESCAFRGVDLRGVRFESCEAADCVFEAPLLDSESLLDLTGPSLTDFHGVVFYEPNQVPATLYSPEEVARSLQSVGFGPAAGDGELRPVDESVVTLVESFARIFEHANIASLNDDFIMRRVVRDRQWPRVFDALIRSGVCSEEVRQAGGNKSFVRMAVRPRDLLAGLDPAANVDRRVSGFWAALETEEPAAPAE